MVHIHNGVLLAIKKNTFESVLMRWMKLKPIIQSEVLGASVSHSAHGKGHEEGGSTYAKAGSSLRSPPRNP